MAQDQFRQDVIRKAVLEIICFFGKDNQLDVCMEEPAELIQAVSKVKRYGLHEETRENLIEEIADVLICIEQLETMFNIDSAEVDSKIEQKIQRTLRRIKEDPYNKQE